eukprot:TRINITY_DN1346_c0_g1_i1.p1 TRINITY_DN1346_c0_g1~~TRINITY_DN1346_c0_g1_i1.p1  ORF type:complete len:161 (-),score=31.94 TRINITY_DN1346_c0_g1_i1:241-693(-)
MKFFKILLSIAFLGVFALFCEARNGSYVKLSPKHIFVEEESAAFAYHVSLSAAPNGPVTFSPFIAEPANVTVYTRELVFDESNWSFPQPVALGSLSGLVNKTTETGLVRGSVASADPVWHAVPVSPVRWTAWRRAGRVGSALGGGVAVGA